MKLDLSFFAALVDLYMMVVLASVLSSWLPMSPDHPVIRFIRSAVDPVLNPIRRVLPQTGGLDFSPMLLIVALQVLRQAVAS